MKILSCYLLLLMMFNNVIAAEIIKVGTYDFPPFANWEGKKLSGLTEKLIKVLNEKQNKFQFVAVETSPKRRYEDFKLGKFDAIFFESLNWGWHDYDIEASKVFMNGGEVFITLKENKTQTYFSELKNKTIKAIDGYHYAFLNFKTDPKEFNGLNAEFSNSHEGNITSVLSKRADLAIVTKEYLDQYFLKKPNDVEKVLVSKKLDQEYKHTILIRKNIPLKVQFVNKLIDQLKKEKAFDKLIK